jgi:hypothetical protein
MVVPGLLLGLILILVGATFAARADDSLCALANKSRRLSMVTLFDGKPEQQASLVFDELTPTKGGSRALWRLTPNAPQGYYLVCTYEKTDKTITRQLSPKFSECVVDYGTSARQSKLPPVRLVQCK